MCNRGKSCSILRQFLPGSPWPVLKASGAPQHGTLPMGSTTTFQCQHLPTNAAPAMGGSTNGTLEVSTDPRNTAGGTVGCPHCTTNVPGPCPWEARWDQSLNKGKRHRQSHSAQAPFPNEYRQR